MSSASLRARLQELRLPVIAAPMYSVSGPELVVAAARAGVAGAFPAANAAPQGLGYWLAQIREELASDPQRGGPWAVSVVAHPSNPQCDEELELLVAHRVPILISALGDPRKLVEAGRRSGAHVVADVSSIRHARKAIEAGVDGLVLICCGAGGHTGVLSPFAFVDAVRAFWTGPVLIAGGVASGRGIRAALALGADGVSMGTPFIASAESRASDAYRRAVCESSADDVVTTRHVTGVPGNFLRSSLSAAGVPLTDGPGSAIDLYRSFGDRRAWFDIFSAGHGVESTRHVRPVAATIDAFEREFGAPPASTPLQPQLGRAT